MGKQDSTVTTGEVSLDRYKLVRSQRLQESAQVESFLETLVFAADKTINSIGIVTDKVKSRTEKLISLKDLEYLAAHTILPNDAHTDGQAENSVVVQSYKELLTASEALYRDAVAIARNPQVLFDSEKCKEHQGIVSMIVFAPLSVFVGSAINGHPIWGTIGAYFTAHAAAPLFMSLSDFHGRLVDKQTVKKKIEERERAIYELPERGILYQQSLDDFVKITTDLPSQPLMRQKAMDNLHIKPSEIEDLYESFSETVKKTRVMQGKRLWAEAIQNFPELSEARYVTGEGTRYGPVQYDRTIPQTS